MRVLLSAVLAVCLCGLTTAREDKKPTVAEQIKALQKQFQEDQQPLIKDFQAAKTDKEKQEIIAKAQAMSAKLAEQMLALASENAKDPAAFDAAMFALQNGQGATSVKAAELIAGNFADNPKLAP